MQGSGKQWQLDMGANVLPGGGVRFRVWAPAARAVEVELHVDGGTLHHNLLPKGDGMFAAVVSGAGRGTRYKFRLDGGASYPDPFSRSQPEGVHGPSEVVDPHVFPWSDAAWPGLGAEGLIIYECHVGTFTEQGTFDSLIDQLPELKRLGITALELMPVAEFPGRWNWGYDGVDLYAPTRNYGGTEGLRRLADAAHRNGLGVILDVVYNHLGPDGNYLRAYSPSYFTDRYTTPWGDALNYDGQDSQWVRLYVVQNVCYWLNEYHLDGLRLDATHAIFDSSPTNIMSEIVQKARRSVPSHRSVVLIAENDSNEVRFIRPVAEGGHGFDAVWADDFHHSVHTLLTGENEGYYRDYPPSSDAIAQTVREGFLYQGEHSAHMGRPRGTKVSDEPASRFVFCLQNHDQIGNRAFGSRLTQLIDLGRYSVASALLLLSPETPLLFMGQEFAASTPFLYFTDHKPDLGKLVTRGRREEFKAFRAFRDPSTRGRIPDPQAESTFRQSRLDFGERNSQAGIYRLYRDLIDLRKSDPVLARQDRFNLRCRALAPSLIALHRWQGTDHRLVLANFGQATCVRFGESPFLSDLASRPWQVLWSTAGPEYALCKGQPGVDVVGGAVEVEIPAACVVVLESLASEPRLA
ncbi:MAG: malto-oligosyltrehalose trehalohydrolase [Chloroflexi bacterium]|nr:malto-oligosyltrehalose trehalohydrolase [Chloroflexota bacterium]